MKRLPVISIVGYTNAGKSTLLNALTHSRVSVKNRLFETLDPSSRRLRFPREREAIVTDTVGFIKKLPKSLMEAFAATLEELHDADLLLHVADATSPRLEEQVETVEQIFLDLGLNGIKSILLLNKTDLLPSREVGSMTRKMGGIAISALSPPTLRKLIQRIQETIWPGEKESAETSFQWNVSPPNLSEAHE